MATILLQSGESFEHFHKDSSLTKHVSGKLKVSFNDVDVTLEDGQIVEIPPLVSHTVTNIGKSEASFDCTRHYT